MSQLGGRHHFNGMEDDDTEVVKAALMPCLKWEDVKHQKQALKALNRMRKNKQFCDVTLRVSRKYFRQMVTFTEFILRWDNTTLLVTASS